jgi:hypothetical protein
MAVAGICNGYETYLDHSLLRALALAGLPPPATMPKKGVDPTVYPSLVGTYHEPRVLGDIVVRLEGGKLFADVASLSVSKELVAEHGLGFVLDEVRVDPTTRDGIVRFLLDGAGKPELLRNRYWIARRTD